MTETINVADLFGGDFDKVTVPFEVDPEIQAEVQKFHPNVQQGYTVPPEEEAPDWREQMVGLKAMTVVIDGALRLKELDD